LDFLDGAQAAVQAQVLSLVDTAHTPLPYHLADLISFA
jgi:hypothetical protein